jgi:transcriptional regulator with XRE-family HTH domain|nr:MAG TPA: helix-turn-helix domain protein [Caudoviricetes sp.]
MPNGSIGARLKALRLDRGLTQDEVGQRVLVSKQTLYKYENDIVTNIPADKIEMLAEVYGVTPAYIMGWEQPPASNEIPTVSPTGKKIDARTRRQLEKVLEDDDLTYNGVVLNAEDKEKVRKALELAFWDIKEMNKRKK